jgi:hypothetical protein
MRYRLRTLLIVLAVGPVALAGAWFAGQEAIREYRARLDNRVPVIPSDAPAPIRGRHVIPSEHRP